MNIKQLSSDGKIAYLIKPIFFYKYFCKHYYGIANFTAFFI